MKKRKSFDFVAWALERRTPPVTTKLANQAQQSGVSAAGKKGDGQNREEDKDNRDDLIEDLDRWMAVCDEVAGLPKLFEDRAIKEVGKQ